MVKKMAFRITINLSWNLVLILNQLYNFWQIIQLCLKGICKLVRTTASTLQFSHEF